MGSEMCIRDSFRILSTDSLIASVVVEGEYLTLQFNVNSPGITLEAPVPDLRFDI